MPQDTGDTVISKTSDVAAVARFVAPLQARPESRMAMVGVEEAGIVRELVEFETELFVEQDDGEILGAAGFDYDEPLARGFIYGPWSIDDDWDARADRLFERALEDAPAAMKDVETAFDLANERAALFAERHGFQLVRDHFTMAMEAHDRHLDPDPHIREMNDDDRTAIVDLHDRCFERAWPAGTQLLEQLEKGPDRKIFVLYQDGGLAGYHFATVDREIGEAFVDNIGVDERFRGRGIATRLLEHGLAWMFGFDEVDRIELSVREENAAAIRVYEKAGFRKLYAVRQMRMPVQSSP